MILDSNLAFDNTVALTVTRDSTNILDMAVNRDMGIGLALQLVITATSTFTAAGAATLTIALQGAPNSGGSPGTWTTYASTIALSLAQVNGGGMIFPIALPRPPSAAVATPRFYKLVYTVATGPFTAGSLYAGLALQRDDMIYYPAGYSTAYI